MLKNFDIEWSKFYGFCHFDVCRPIDWMFSNRVDMVVDAKSLLSDVLPLRWRRIIIAFRVAFWVN